MHASNYGIKKPVKKINISLSTKAKFKIDFTQKFFISNQADQEKKQEETKEIQIPVTISQSPKNAPEIDLRNAWSSNSRNCRCPEGCPSNTGANLIHFARADQCFWRHSGDTEFYDICSANQFSSATTDVVR